MRDHTYRGHRTRTLDLPIADGILHPDLLPDELAREVSTPLRNHREPYVGVTADGTPVDGLYHLAETGLSHRKALDAATAYLDTLERYQLPVARLPMDSPDWRLWTNAFPVWTPKGLRLSRLTSPQREAALAVIEASLSAEGYAAIRTAMKLNDALGDLIQTYRDSLGEYTYQFTIFGEPSAEEPWGWQLAGHHVDVHCVFVGSQLVLAPVFLGAEPAQAWEDGPYAGVSLFERETEGGLAMRRSLTEDQEERFLMGRSLRIADLPPEFAGPTGRQLSGAGQDNLVLPPEGISGKELSREQRQLLLELADVYIKRLPDGHAGLKRSQFEEHLGDTRFAWRGGHGDTSAFYYRIHSPVLLVEYDNEAGIFLDNDEAERFHVHTITREPNGNDYGKNLLAQHYQRFHS
ncbi:DUF3500 domain-containing protein [Catenulispora pinisilvae]|uniref:DUF3500 domain-containing protein n=1 Tax=Catenulispora pinisilvae TaxID=2705253 RepID=UPI0018917A60|nr:DUF3500 domain-containing protein [Catenulispora pinisilvae]